MILGKKVGMTQIFEDKKLVPVTVIEVGSNFVVQIKTNEKEGYNLSLIHISEPTRRSV